MPATTAPAPAAATAADKPTPAAAPVMAEKPPQPAMPKLPAPDPNAPVVVNLRRAGDTLRLEFPFAVPTPAAVFRRAGTLWLVFDSAAKIDLAALATSETSQLFRSSTVERGADGEAIVRIRLERPQVASLAADGPSWLLTIGDGGTAPTRPLVVARAAHRQEPRQHLHSLRARAENPHHRPIRKSATG